MSRLLFILAALQAPPAWRDSAERLAGEVRRLAESFSREEVRLPVVRRTGQVVLSASLRFEPVADRVLAAFVETRTRLFGTATPGGTGFRILLRTGAGSRTTPEMLAIAEMPDSDSGTRVTVTMPRRSAPRVEELVRMLTEGYTQLLLSQAPEPLRAWVPGSLALALGQAGRRDEAMYGLVTGKSAGQRECLQGEIAACIRALGLGPPRQADPGAEYYPEARTDLMLHALGLGGDSAWSRLRADSTASALASLAAAAGIQSDSLIASWRRSLLEQRPARGPLRSSAAFAFLFWSAASVILTLGVSRWA